MLVHAVAASLIGGFRVMANVYYQYPKEPLLDVDYLHDANNPLDNFTWDKRPTSTPTPPPTTPPTTPPPTTPPPATTSAPDADEAAAAEAAAVAAAAAAEVAGAEAKDEVSMIGSCVTSKDRRGGWWSETAVEGTPCLFGTDARDEAAHCITDIEQRYGEFGWCWTKEDKSEWGSCSRTCPLFGSAQKLMLKVKKFATVVNHWRDLLAQEKAAREAAGVVTAAAYTTPPPDEQAVSAMAVAEHGPQGPQYPQGSSGQSQSQGSINQIPQGLLGQQGAQEPQGWYSQTSQMLREAQEAQGPQAPQEPQVTMPLEKVSPPQNLLTKVAQPLKEVTRPLQLGGKPTALLTSENKKSPMSLKALFRLAAKEVEQHQLQVPEPVSDIALFEVYSVLKRQDKKHYCAWDETKETACT